MEEIAGLVPSNMFNLDYSSLVLGPRGFEQMVSVGRGTCIFSGNGFAAMKLDPEKNLAGRLNEESQGTG